MTADILMVNGSPRPEGNCARLVDACGQVFDQHGRTWERVDLRQLRIGPCRACGQCIEHKAKYCSQPDDMAPVYDQLLGCKALLLLSPVYWFNYNAQLKGFIDRMYGLWNWDRGFLAGKKAGAVLVYADADPYLSGGVNAIASFEHLFRFTGADYRGVAYGTAAEPGDAERNPDLMERVRTLAESLLG